MIREEDFVKIVKRAGSIKKDPTKKNLKIIKRAAHLIGSQEYIDNFALHNVSEETK